jgi:hypothetical protein
VEPLFDLDEWRQRLAATYPEHCPLCKLRYDDAEQIENRLRGKPIVDLTRHSECGHILMYRGGVLAWARDLLVLVTDPEGVLIEQYLEQTQPDPPPVLTGHEAALALRDRVIAQEASRYVVQGSRAPRRASTGRQPKKS